MRISDWSSDVCSSDLKSHGDGPTLADILELGAARRSFACRRRGRRQDRRRRRPAAAPDGRRRDAGAYPLRSAPPAVDRERTSVLEGRVVSVSVGLCGGRIIKYKQNIYNTNTEK